MPAQILPTALYDAEALRVTLGISKAAIARAREAGTLRFTRQGTKFLFLGSWVLDWLERDATAATASRESEEQG